jgi:hypothetical protein
MGSMSKGRNARKYARAHIGVYLVTLGIVWHPVAARAGVEGDLELLQRTAMMIRENRDKIRYWQGSATINVDEKDRQGAWLRQEERSASFWLSRDLDAVRWSMSIDSLKFPDAGGRLAEAQSILRRTDEWSHPATTTSRVPRQGRRPGRPATGASNPAHWPWAVPTTPRQPGAEPWGRF